MAKKVIFDFNRTLFDPETFSLDENAPSVLRKLKEKGFDLFLISHGSRGEEFLEELGIKDFFEKFLFVEIKTKELFKEIVNGEDAIVVGDRVKHEIKIGNLLGFKTVWLKRGKFAEELPENKEEEPDFTIQSLEELINLEL